MSGSMLELRVCVTIGRGVVLAGNRSGKRDSMTEKSRAKRTMGREVLCGGLLTGLGTGLAWSSVVELFSMDQRFSGTEFLTSLVVPGLVAVLVWKLWRTGLVNGVIVAYLTGWFRCWEWERVEPTSLSRPLAERLPGLFMVPRGRSGQWLSTADWLIRLPLGLTSMRSIRRRWALRLMVEFLRIE